MNKVEPFWKRYGETPKEALERFRAKQQIDGKVPLSYAGRLDPLAEGVLLILVGEANKERDTYVALPKTYEYEIVFGIRTDTHDVLGMPTVGTLESVTEKDIVQFLEKSIGTHPQTYPAFSSKPYKGKPLFMHAKEGTVSYDELPTHDITVFSHTLTALDTIGGDEIIKAGKHACSIVSGDFRQNEISLAWDNLSSVIAHKTFYRASVCVTCGSGTYVRGFARDIGDALGVGAIAFRITRSTLGSYTVR
ncbi:MAG: hypothetical protein WDZ88_04030 [Candidatus Paceibacterota bacterium]